MAYTDDWTSKVFAVSVDEAEKIACVVGVVCYTPRSVDTLS